MTRGVRVMVMCVFGVNQMQGSVFMRHVRVNVYLLVLEYSISSIR